MDEMLNLRGSETLKEQKGGHTHTEQRESRVNIQCLLQFYLRLCHLVINCTNHRRSETAQVGPFIGLENTPVWDDGGGRGQRGGVHSVLWDLMEYQSKRP